MTHEAVKGLEEDTRLLPIYPKEKKKKKKMMLFCHAQASCSRKNPQIKVISLPTTTSPKCLRGHRGDEVMVIYL